jgi:AraC family transcriptional regulator of adaptative response/methylated-DNA-[protein]-cysteine methyltransferase
MEVMAAMNVIFEMTGMADETAVTKDLLAWEQVLGRNPRADGDFVYAVTTTGIYCRPSCPSRRPALRNVRFFAGAEEAEAAGFRPCLRCEPRRKGAKPDPHTDAVARAVEILREAKGENVALADLARQTGMSRFTLLRAFQRTLGVTPAEFARARRQERFRTEVRVPGNSVTEAVYAAGFGSSSRLYENVAETLGMRPSAMKAGGAGEMIRWSVAQSPLGRVLVACTERGLCAVLFADSAEEAERELRQRFPRAELQRDSAGLREAADFVLSQMTENPGAASLPFDVRATAFQHRVWEALRAIPRGETRTYAQIAHTVGSPKAVRAVGAACGANPLAVVVPCHRAVGSDGRLTGYRWGLERKRKLLAIERRDEPAERN